MRVFAPRSMAYASNSEIFLFWMVGTSLVLLTVAIIFLRNQIRPILRLADAAEAFGKGRDAPNFRPRGAREVRRAAVAFIEMKLRVERAIEQRTTMLAGVSHDLRTILTRFKLELAMLGNSAEIDALKKDVDEMQRMLEAYLAFARGDMGEQSAPTDMADFLQELKDDAERTGHKASVDFSGAPIVTVKSAAFKRCLANLVTNAARYAHSIAITGHRDHRWLTVTIDDDGPGIPSRSARKCSSRSFGSTMRAIRTRAARGSASPSRATSRAPMAATSCWAIRRSGACAPPCACRCSGHFAGESRRSAMLSGVATAESHFSVIPINRFGPDSRGMLWDGARPTLSRHTFPA